MTPRTNTVKLKAIHRFSILDPMRFLAALFVVLYHYSINFDDQDFFGLTRVFYFGYLGVPFFFILSGFVISASAEKRSAVEFAIARAARLYPAFWASLVFTVAIAVLLGESVFSFSEVIANATILNDYIGIKNIDGVYWTLQAELKFYGCIMLLLLLGAYTSYHVWLTGWLICSVAYYFFNQPFFMGVFINPAYSFFFIGGVCSQLLYKEQKKHFPLILLCFTTIFSMAVGYSQVTDFYPSADHVDKTIATFIIGCFYVFFIALAYGKLNIRPGPWLKLLGAVSYPLYLIHNRAGKDIIDFLAQFMVTGYAVTITIILMIITSILIHIYIERWLSPAMIKLGRNFIPKQYKFEKNGANKNTSVIDT